MLLPGMDGTGEFFDDFVAALGGACPTVVVRYPRDRPLGYDELEPIVRAAVPAGPFVVLGESFSGPLAIRLAATAPPGLQGLVLCASFVRRPVASMPGMHLFAGRLPAAWVASLLGPLLLGSFSTPQRRAALARSVSAVEPAVWRARLRAVMQVDDVPRLSAVKVPVLYLRATRDRLVAKHAAESVKRCQARTEVIDFEAPHFLLQTVPMQAAQAVLGFIRGMPPSA
jgi:pimeloyl-ACP methyl ester carboxylesterase